MVAFRIALLIGLIWLLWRLYRLVRGPAAIRSDDPGAREAFTPTVQCAVCGLVIPADNAIRRDGQVYCEQHDPQRPDASD